MSVKSMIYKALRISNDINAIKKGKIAQRVGRRITGRMTSKMMNKMFK